MKKLCVIFGGDSCEHDISVITGMQLAKNVETKREIEKIYLGLDNRFYLATKINDLSYFSNKNKINLKEIVISNNAVYIKGFKLRKLFDIECMVNCCHGGVGENGDLAGFFAVNGVKFTSADTLSSHIAMDKSLTKSLVLDIVPTILGAKVTKQNYKEKIKYIKENFDDNLIVKPNSLGSSIGVKACDKTNFKNQIDAIFELKDDALVENRILDITEYNQAAMMVNGKIVLSAIEKPLTKHEILTFDDKYKGTKKVKGKDRELPAQISIDLQKQICEHTKNIYSRLNLSGVVRIDYIFDNATNKLYFNEVNTVPGSMAFYLFEPVGIDYITLVELLVANAKDVKSYRYLDTKILENKKI